MVIKRIVYLPYYILKTNWKLFFNYLRGVKKEKNVSYLFLWREVLYTMIKHNASPLDYFSFRFFDLPKTKWAEYPCTGFMYEYQLKMNPPGERMLLEDKKIFLERFNIFSGRQWATLERLKKDRGFATGFLNSAGKRLVVKNSTGQAGKQVDVIEVPPDIPDGVIAVMEKGNFDLAEHYVVQHDELMRMSPSALNTIRMVTQYTGNDAVILFAFLRISVNSEVDNLSVGSYGVNFGAAIDLESGKINRPGCYLDSTKPEVFFHPVTGVPIVGFQIPYWGECRRLAIDAAKLALGNRSVGWDVAVTNEGPVLIEGNHNWNLLSMYPGKKGFKREFQQYLKDLKSETKEKQLEEKANAESFLVKDI